MKMMLCYVAGAAIACAAYGNSQANVSANRYEFRANTYTPSAQEAAVLCVQPDGTFLVAWESRRQQSGRYGVYAQRFDADGIAIGGETALGLWNQSHQSRPAIAAAPNAGIWVAWQSHGQDGSGSAIVARRLRADLTGGSEILVNQVTRGDQTLPVIASGPSGELLAVWSSQSSRNARATLSARLLNADGTPRGDEFTVSPSAHVNASAPAVAFRSDGSFAVAYSSIGADGRPEGVWMQRYTADGKALGAVLDVDGAPAVSPVEPVVAATPTGFFVAWHDATSDGDGYGVVARRFDASGRPLCEPFVVNTNRAGQQSGAALAVRPDGSLLVAWNGDDGDHDGIFGQRYDASGAPAGGEFRVSVATEGPQRLCGCVSHARVAFGLDGRTLAVWSGKGGPQDKNEVYVTMGCDQPLALNGRTQGVTAEMTRAQPQVVLAAGPQPHIPPTFDPLAVDQADEREIVNTRGAFGFTAVNNTGWTPPDPHMAVGPNHIVVMTNGRIAAYDKAGVLQFQDEIEDSFGFWGSVGASGFVFDPEVLYDELSGRFIAMAAEAFAPPGGTHSYVLIAVSDDSNPNGTWYKYRFDTTATSGDLFDSPNIGVDATAVYVTGDGFPGAGATYPVYIWDKASLLAGSPPAISKSFLLSTSTQSAGIPPVAFDNPPAYYMIEHKEAATNTQVRLIALTNPLGTPATTTFTLTVPSYAPPGDPAQQGTTARPETFDGRFWSCAYRNGSLWATHHADNPVKVRWYEVAMNGWPTSGQNPALVQSGVINPGALIYLTFSSITVDDAGNAVLCFTRSASNEYLSMWSAYRLACDPLGTFSAPALEKASTTSDTSGRWGDYSAVSADPAEPGAFWGHHEYTTGSWRTWVSKITLPVVEPIPGDLDHDCDVDLDDLSIMLVHFGTTSGATYEQGDVDGDGDVDLDDLSLLLVNFGS